jgi:crossover junction endodeoxyribonuclease RuvC
MIILGIDPGSRITGYGIIKSIKQQQQYLTSGCIKITSNDWGYRLKQIYDDLLQIITQYKPQQISIEKIFVHKNASSALKLGQARGAAIVAAATIGIPIHEYSARQIKQAVVGFGNADKKQVQSMVQTILSLDKKPQEDAADALAIAMCHGLHTASLLTKIWDN